MHVLNSLIPLLTPNVTTGSPSVIESNVHPCWLI